MMLDDDLQLLLLLAVAVALVLVLQRKAKRREEEKEGRRRRRGQRNWWVRPWLLRVNRAPLEHPSSAPRPVHSRGDSMSSVRRPYGLRARLDGANIPSVRSEFYKV